MPSGLAAAARRRSGRPRPPLRSRPECARHPGRAGEGEVRHREALPTRRGDRAAAREGSPSRRWPRAKLARRRPGQRRSIAATPCRRIWRENETTSPGGCRRVTHPHCACLGSKAAEVVRLRHGGWWRQRHRRSSVGSEVPPLPSEDRALRRRARVPRLDEPRGPPRSAGRSARPRRASAHGSSPGPPARGGRGAGRARAAPRPP